MEVRKIAVPGYNLFVSRANYFPERPVLTEALNGFGLKRPLEDPLKVVVPISSGGRHGLWLPSSPLDGSDILSDRSVELFLPVLDRLFLDAGPVLAALQGAGLAFNDEITTELTVRSLVPIIYFNGEQPIALGGGWFLGESWVGEGNCLLNFARRTGEEVRLKRVLEEGVEKNTIGVGFGCGGESADFSVDVVVERTGGQIKVQEPTVDRGDEDVPADSLGVSALLSRVRSTDLHTDAAEMEKSNALYELVAS